MKKKTKTKPKIEVTRLTINGSVFGVVVINGQPAKLLKVMHGVRTIFTGSGIIVKLNDYNHLNQVNKEIKLWREKISKSRDRQYFARPVAYKEGKYGWIAQEHLKFRGGRPRKEHWETIERVAKKYGILKEARGYNKHGKLREVLNWNVTKEGNPVIFDWGY